VISVPEFLSICNHIAHLISKGLPIVHLCLNDYFSWKLLRSDLEKRISMYFNTVAFTKQTQNGNIEVPACGGGGGYCV
jgi:hypothetical protein